MDWDDLRLVLAVHRQGTPAAAARALTVDPTTVGRRFLAVETALGSRLFDRTADGFRATLAGRLSVAGAEEVDRTAAALLREVGGSDSRIEGPVRLTALAALHPR